MKKTIIIIGIIIFTLSSIFAQRPTGTFNLGSPTLNCQSGFTCNNFSVTGVGDYEKRPSSGIIAIWPAVGQTQVDLFFSGHSGGLWWNTSSLSQSFFQHLHQDGHTVVQVIWAGNGWPAAEGVDQGFVPLAVRPATVIQYVRSLYPGTPLSVIGSSEGSAALGYSLAAYGVQVDLAVFVSGPPMTDISDGCMESAQTPNPCCYGYVIAAETFLVGEPFNTDQPNTPNSCANHDASFIPQWTANSVESVPGGSYFYPDTRVQFIVGAHDESTIRNHAQLLYSVLNGNNQPNLNWQEIENMAHSIQNSQDGLNFLFGVLTQ